MPIVQAELATAEAEWSRLHPGRGGAAERWREAVARWDELSFPHPVAYARWRLADALLQTGAHLEQASSELTAAWQGASMLGAEPLRRHILALAERARIPLPDDDTQPGAAAQPVDGLTQRERQILALLADGHGNRRIAQELFISEKTVSVHVTHILAKLGVSNRNQAGAVARRAGPTS